MLSRRQTLRAAGAVGAAGIAAPGLAACGDVGHGAARPEQHGHTALRLVKADVTASAGDPSAAPGVADAIRAFTHDLWGALPAKGNLAVSPYSIDVALAMTTNGAVGATQRQMRDVLHVDSLATYNAGLAALTHDVAGLAGPVKVYDKTESLELAAANQLFGDASVQWQQAFLTVLGKMYDAGLITVDFVRHTEEARALVNRWTSGQTHGRIDQILPRGSIDVTTRLVLVNALYLKAPWATPFEKSSTAPGDFHRADGTTVTASFMHGDAHAVTFVSGAGFTGARIPYAGGGLAMTVALPDGDEISALRGMLDQLTEPPSATPAELVMPRFTYRVSLALKPPLEELGMTDAFDPDRADFSGMTDEADLFVSAVLHQTFVAVDESGTEAAAATAVVMNETSGFAGEIPKVVLDRPFLFVIHDVAHGTPLFVGRVADPT